MHKEVQGVPKGHKNQTPVPLCVASSRVPAKALPTQEGEGSSSPGLWDSLFLTQKPRDHKLK